MSAVARKALTFLFRAERPAVGKTVNALPATRARMTAMREQEGRWPTADELAELMAIPLEVADNLRDEVLLDEVLEGQAARSKDGAVAIRQIEQAVRCLPRSQRARYRQEWRAELASLPIAQWIPYAIGVLNSAPGLSMTLSRREGRRRPEVPPAPLRR